MLTAKPTPPTNRKYVAPSNESIDRYVKCLTTDTMRHIESPECSLCNRVFSTVEAFAVHGRVKNGQWVCWRNLNDYRFFYNGLPGDDLVFRSTTMPDGLIDAGTTCWGFAA